MQRILVFGMTENPGGVESFLLNYYRHMNRDNIQFDFLCNTHQKVAYEDELLSLGAHTFHITPRRQNPAAFRRELNELFALHSGQWSAVWVNVSSLANIEYLKTAKRYEIEKRIIHSHNSQNMDSRLRGVLHQLNRHFIGKYATDFWACSQDAARWFYTGKTMKKAVIVHNAIDVERMAFDPAKREAIRKAHGWENKRVIGNVGRLHFQKNQSFALDVFKRYHTAYPGSVLVFVGQGEDEQILRGKADALGLADSVVFAGIQKDVQAWLSSFDLFLFPSRFEGLSVSAMEAQANGVPVLASRGVIPDEVKINENFVFFDLSRGAEAWSRKIEEMTQQNREPFVAIKHRFQEKGFDIQTEAGKLEELLAARSSMRILQENEK